MPARSVFRLASAASLVLGLLSFPWSGWQGVAEAQSTGGDAQVMSEAEKEALRDWAHRRFKELEAGPSAPPGGLPHSQATERLWALYFLNVEEKEWEASARALADSLSRVELPEAHQVEALAGALEVIRAKHSRWPPNKLRYLRDGLSVLNRLVAERPQDAAIRYLRLMSTYYLPFFQDQDDAVQEDLEALCAMLPESGAAFSPPVYAAALRFVLDRGNPDAETRARMEAALNDLWPGLGGAYGAPEGEEAGR